MSGIPQSGGPIPLTLHGTGQGAGSPSDVLTRLRRRKGAFAIAALGTGALVAALFLILPKTYLATAAVIVASPDTLTGQSSPAMMEKLGDDADMESQILVLRSPRLLGEILGEPVVAGALRAECEAARTGSILATLKSTIGLGNSCEKLLGGRATALDWLDNHLTVKSAGRSRVIDISYQSVLPDTASTVANALARAYLAEKESEKSGSREAAVAWLRSEIARRGQELQETEVAVENYRRDHGLARGETAPFSSEQLSSLGKLLANAEASRADAAARLQQLGPNPSDSTDALEARPVLESHTISELRVKRAAILANIAHLAATYGSRSSVLTSLQHEQEAIDRQIQDETARIAASIRHEYEAASAEVAALTSQLDALKRDVGKAGGAEAAIAGMVRDIEVRREIYVDLAKKANELETERRVLTGDAQLVNFAETPFKVWFPKPVLFAGIGTILSLAAGCMAALFADRRDRSVRAAGGVEAELGVPVLGHVPEVKALEQRSLFSLQSARPSALQESIRTLYAHCMLVPRADRLRTIMVTSSEPGEGKTFLTLTLAAFAAAAGKRVLAIENDLRRPSFGQSLRLAPGPGLTAVLMGEASLAAAVRRDVQTGFDVLPAGRAAINSTELLSGERFDQVLASAASHYDLVLLDTPPSLVLMDARILAGRVDGVLYCALWGSSQVDTVNEGIKGIRSAGGRIIGLVLDRVHPLEHRLYEDVRTIYPGPYIAAPSG